MTHLPRTDVAILEAFCVNLRRLNGTTKLSGALIPQRGNSGCILCYDFARSGLSGFRFETQELGRNACFRPRLDVVNRIVQRSRPSVYILQPSPSVALSRFQEVDL